MRRLNGFQRILFIDPKQFIFRDDVSLDATLFESARDRLHDHRIGVDFSDDQCRHSFLDQAQRRAPTGLAHGSPCKGHNIVDGFRRSQIRGKSRRGVFGALGSMEREMPSLNRSTPSIKATFVFITTPPSFSLLKIQITWNIFYFFYSNLSIFFNLLASMRNLET